MIEVVAALLEQDGRFLACQRPKEKNCGLMWEFAGGKVEAGETREQALARECREELGVSVEVQQAVAQVTQAYPEYTVHLTLMRVRIKEGEIAPTEHAAWRMMTLEEAKEYAFCPADMRLLNALRGESVDHAARAKALFEQGYNCAQSVVGAFCEEMGLTQAQAMRLSSSMGGGVGGMRDLCGAVSGMALVAGMLWGYDTTGDYEAKKSHYARVRALAEDFRAIHGSMICRELLAGVPGGLQKDPQPRTAEYYAVRPCGRFVQTAARLLEERLYQGTDEAQGSASSL